VGCETGTEFKFTLTTNVLLLDEKAESISMIKISNFKRYYSGAIRPRVYTCQESAGMCDIYKLQRAVCGRKSTVKEKQSGL
jgi:hypothetical protein